MVNVEGDSIGAGIVAHLSRKQLKKIAYDEDTSADDNTPEKSDSLPAKHDAQGFSNKAFSDDKNEVYTTGLWFLKSTS